MNNLSMVRRLDAIFMFIKMYEPFLDPGVTFDTITVLVSVRENLAKGTEAKGVLSTREQVIEELSNMQGLSPSEAAEEILEDLRRGGEL